MTSNTTPSGVASASGYHPDFYPWQAMMDDNSDLWNSWVAIAGVLTGCWLQYEFGSAQLVAGYAITSRNEGGGLARVPKAWELRASNTEISAIPTMTSNTTPSGVASASSYVGAFYPWKAMSSNNTDEFTSWAASGTSGWLQYQFPSAKIITSYSITSRNEGGGLARAPKAWTLEASSTGVFGGEEVTLDSQSGITDWASGANIRKTFSFSNTTAYVYYRLYITESNDATHIGIGEFELSETTPAVLDIQINITDWASGANITKEFNFSNSAEYKYYQLLIQASNDGGYVGIGEFELFGAEGWTGKICGVTNPSKICGIPVSAISKVCGV